MTDKSNNISEKLDSISSEIKDVTGEIVSHFLTEKDNSIIQSDNINKNIDYTRGQILERVETNTEKLSEEVTDLQTGINTIKERIEDIKKASSNTDVLIDKLDTITNDVKGITGELINQISQDEEVKNEKYQIINNNINYAKQELTEQIVEGNKNTSKEISQLFENIENSKNEINQNLTANATLTSQIINDTESAKTEIIEANNIELQNAKEQLTSTIHTSEFGINQRIESLTDKIQETKNDIITQLQAGANVSENVESLKYEIKILDDKVEEASNALINNSNLTSQDIHTNINTTRESIVAELSDKISDSTSKISEQFKETTNNVKEQLQEFAGENTKEVLEIVNRIVLALDKKNNFVSDKTDELFSRIKDSISNFQANVEFSNRVLIDSIKNENEEVKTKVEALPALLDNTGKSLLEKVNAISAASNTKAEELIDIINNLKFLLEENNQGIHDNINSKYTSILTELSNILESNKNETVGIINNNITELKSILNTLIVSNNDTNNTVDANSEQLHNILETVRSLFNTISESDTTILEKFATEYEDLKNLITKLGDSASENKQALSELIYTRVGSIETLLSKIEAKQDINKTEIYDHILESIDNIKNIAEDTDLRINESINKMRELQDKSIEILNETQGTIDNKLFEIKDSSTQFYSNIEQHIDNLKSILISKADWEDKFNDMEGALINLSRDLNILTNQSPNHADIENIYSELEDLKREFKEILVETSNSKNDFMISELSRHFDNISETFINSFEKQQSTIISDNKINTDNIIETINSIKPEIEKINNIVRENGIKNVDSISAVKNVLNNISNLFSETETKINESIQEKTDSLATQLDTLSNSIKLLDENIDEDTTRQLTIIQDELSAITSALFTNTDKMTLSSKLHFDEVYEKFEYVSDLINKVQSEQAQISRANIETITESFNNLNKVFEECDSIKLLLTNLDENIDKYSTQITKKIEDTSSQTLVEQCINKVEDVENKLDKLNFTTSNSEEADKILLSNIEQLKQKLALVEENVDNLTKNTLSEEISEVKELINNENNQIKLLIKESSPQEQVELCLNKVDILDNKLNKLDFTNKNLEEADKLIITNVELIEQKLENIEDGVEALNKNTLISNEIGSLKELINTQKEQLNTLSTADDIRNLPNINDISDVIKTKTVELLENFNKTFEEHSTKEVIAKQLSELKSDILSQTVTILDQISFEVEQGEIMDYIQENYNNIKAYIEHSKDELINKANLNKEELLNTLVSKNDIASEFDYVNKKLDDLSDTYELQKGFEDVHSKLDDIVESTIEKGFEDVHSKLDYVADNTIKKELHEVKSQLETVANNDELQREFEEVKKHLLTIQSGDSKADYTYSLQDIESDIAKLRIAMKELQDVTPDEELDNLTKKVDGIVMVVDSIKHQISQAEIDEIGANVEKMNEDIISISSRTNKLILTSENSANMLKENIDSFKLVIDDMDERTRVLAESHDLSDVHNSISHIKHTLEENTNHNQVVNQSLIAIAEWVDYAGSTLTSISDKVNKLNDIEDIKAMIRSIEMPKQFDYSVFDSIEEKFSAQQDKIDVLEEKINRLTELVEANDNSQMNKKMTSIDRQLAKLNKSIERLTSYVDEE